MGESSSIAKRTLFAEEVDSDVEEADLLEEGFVDAVALPAEAFLGAVLGL